MTCSYGSGGALYLYNSGTTNILATTCYFYYTRISNGDGGWLSVAGTSATIRISGNGV